MNEMALLVFTLLVQAAIGIMAFTAVGKLVNKDSIYKSSILTSAGLSIVGLLASLMHLGRPLAAVNALAQFGSSWLSREIWFTAAFTGLTVLAALWILFKPKAKGAINALILIAAIVGLADVFVMASIYNFSSVKAWQYSSIFVEFYAAALSMGAILFMALGRKEASPMRRAVTLVLGATVILQVVAMVLYYIQLGANDSFAAQQSLSRLNSMGGAMAFKWLFILLGAGLVFLPTKNANMTISAGQAAMETAVTKDGTWSNNIFLAAALIIVGQIVGRYLFYAIMVTSTVGLS